MDSDNDLSVSGSAAIVGTNGMAALVNGSTVAYLQDDTPQSETHYRVSFYFDPNSISMPSHSFHRILVARSANADAIRLEIRFRNGNYQVRARARTDSGGYANSSWYVISDTAHQIELDWQASSSAGANDGYLSLWIDGILMRTLSGVDNDTLRIEQLRLGPSGGYYNTTSGTELFDDFASWRTVR